MPWGAAIGGALGAAGSIFGSSSAAKKQAKAEKAALALQESQFNTTRDDNMPALQARNNALLQMQTLAQEYGGGPTAEEVMAEPGYQFGLDQGRNALEGSAAAAGGLYSGNTGKNLQKWGTDYATGKYTDAFNRKQATEASDFNRYASISGQGQTGANALAMAGANYANNSGDIRMSGTNAQGAAAIAQGNTYGGLGAQVGSALKGWFQQPGASAGVSAATRVGGGNKPGTINNGYYGLDEYADGGPVQSDKPDPALVAKYTARLNQILAERKAKEGMGRIAPTDRIEMAEKKALGFADGGAVRWSGSQEVDAPMQPQFQARPQQIASQRRVQVTRASEPNALRGMAAPGPDGAYQPDAMAPQMLAPGPDGAYVPDAPQRMGFQPVRQQFQQNHPAMARYLQARPRMGIDQSRRQFSQPYEQEEKPSLWEQGFGLDTPGRMAPRPRMGIGAPNRLRGYADGGRVEPRIGSRSALREGGGGGMSTNALLQAMIRQKLEERQMQRPNPLNPRAVLEDREARVNYMDGGEVDGPGGPRDDMVPAWLSDQEHVFDEPAVTAFGNGSNERGQMKLNALRAMLKGGM